MKLLLAISGGIDSAVLLDQFCAVGQDELTIAYFNHGTSFGKRAEKLVMKLAKKYELPLELGSTKKQLKSEADFRAARYDWLGKTAKKLICVRIVTAHHADDQAETVLMNLTRGSGLAGLGGMTELTELPKHDGVQIWRPLLGTPKSEIVKYAKRRKLDWLDDPTNANPKFARNRLRKNVLPELAKINPHAQSALLRTAKQIREADAFIQQAAEKWLEKKTALPLAAFTKLAPALQKAILKLIYKKEIGHTQGLEEVHFAEIIALAKNPAGNKQNAFGKLIFKTSKKGNKRALIWKKASSKIPS